MLKGFRKKSTNCRADDARFLLLLCLGREPYSPAELDIYLEQSFFGALKRIVQSPLFAHSVFDPYVLGKRPLQLVFDAGQRSFLQKYFAIHFDIDDRRSDACAVWPGILAAALETPRMQKAFIRAHSLDRLAFLQRLLADEPSNVRSGHEMVSAFAHPAGGVSVRGYAYKETTTAALTLDFYLNGKPAGTTVANRPSRETSEKLGLKRDIGFEHKLDVSNVRGAAEATLLIFERETGVMICPPRQVITDVFVANELLAHTTQELAAFRALNEHSKVPAVEAALVALQERLPTIERFADIPLENYATYKAVYQPAAPDVGAGAVPKIALIVPDGQADMIASQAYIMGQTYRNFGIVEVGDGADLTDYDLAVPLMEQEKLHVRALQNLAHAAVSHPEAQVFRAGYDHFVANNYIDPRFAATFDPLLLEQMPGYARAFAIRCKVLQSMAECGDPQALLSRVFTASGSDAFAALDDVLFSYSENDVGADIQPLLLPSPDTGLKLAIIIPSKDRLDLLKPCFESLEGTIKAGRTTEIIIVDNNSSDPEAIAWLENIDKHRSPDQPAVRILRYDQAFNWADMNNSAVRETDADLLLFLNNDTLAIDEGWDLKVRGLLSRPKVGAVGARLLFADDTLQHGGALLSADGRIRHEGTNLSKTVPGYANRLQVTRQCEAVTGAFLACSRQNYEVVEGFDGKNFPVTYNDIDFCLKMTEQGLAVLFTPLVTFYHLESQSRGYDGASAKKTDRERLERNLLLRKWAKKLPTDRWFPKQLEYTGSDGQILLVRPLYEPSPAQAEKIR